VIGYWLIIVFLANSWIVRTVRKQRRDSNKKNHSKERIFLALINGLSAGIVLGNIGLYPQHDIWNWEGLFIGALIIGVVTWITTLISEGISRRMP
jgi:hypothetical protein